MKLLLFHIVSQIGMAVFKQGRNEVWSYGSNLQNNAVKHLTYAGGPAYFDLHPIKAKICSANGKFFLRV